jgi:isoaspartyl peptidase/L-asparaginase-like protein (Ntn-hydrolase superfamily)
MISCRIRLQLVPNSYFITATRRQKYKQWKVQHNAVSGHLGTTGAVAFDTHGNVACQIE